MFRSEIFSRKERKERKDATPPYIACEVEETFLHKRRVLA